MPPQLMTFLWIPFIMVFHLIVTDPAREELVAVRTFLLTASPVVFATEPIYFLLFLLKAGDDLKVEMVR